MRREGQPLWKKLFGNPSGREQEEKVLGYVVQRVRAGADLEEAVREDYVRRNLAGTQVDELVKDPGLVRAAREQMESDLGSAKTARG